MDKKSRDFVMGKLYLKNKDYRMAEKSFAEYLSVNPEDYQALKMLAQVHEQLNDTAKAFDLYQRCYLSQPDRSGVLLDICRLLLYNNPHLEHVDKKKWLKLAEQAFPTNPIIRNLRESLPNGQDSHSGKITLTDKVMDKLNVIEDLLRNFEDRFGNFEDRFRGIEDRFGNFEDRFKSIEDRSRNIENRFTSLEILLKQKEAKPESIKEAKLESTKEAKLESTKEAKLESTKEAKLESTKEAKPESTKAVNLSAKPFVEKLDKEFGNFSLNPPEIFKPFSESFGKFHLPTAQPTSTGDSKLMAGNLDGVNLFAESIKKLQLPTESPWSKPAQENEDDNDDDGVVPTEELPIENTCDMRPIEIKTGEEDEDILFKQRCKLYRFRDKEYKERGLGDIKVLKHKETGKGRLIMRREMINLVCLNCWSCQNIERVRDNQIRFAGSDASDGDAEMTVFLVKFKTADLADEFLKHLEDLFADE